MRGLTFWRPWLWAILHAPPETQKDIENRPWEPWASILGERIALHSGRHYEDDDATEILATCGVPFGAGFPSRFEDEGIVGVARVSGCLSRFEDVPVTQRKWWRGPFAWTLVDKQALPDPIPFKGKQGLWLVPEEIEREIQIQLVNAAAPPPPSCALELREAGDRLEDLTGAEAARRAVGKPASGT